MSNNYFQFKRFTVFQDHCAMKVGTDGTLLGAWARGGKRILDIGTGTGLIALMMAQRFPIAKVWAVDIDEDACDQAERNIKESPFSGQISVQHCDIRTAAFSKGTFDCIICNPPYFQHSLKNPDDQRRIARHTDTLTYNDLFSVAFQLLSNEGEMSVIIPFDCVDELKSTASIHGFFLSRECGVKTTPKKHIRRYLLSFCKHSVENVEKTVGVIDDAPGQRSQWYENLTVDFYLS